MRIVFSLTLLFFLSQVSYAQNAWIVSGFISGDKGEPLAGASVIANNVLAAVSDTSGFYSLTRQEIPGSITIRCLCYFPQKTNLKATDFHQGKARINFSLVNQAPVLDEITISAKPIEKILKEDFTTDLYDFGFVGKNLLLLLRVKKQYYIQLIRDDGERLSSMTLPEECRVLHHSCMGNFHVVGEKSAWEIALRGNTIDTLTRYSATSFHQLVEPCAQQSGGRYYMAKHGLLNQSLSYIVYEDNKPPRLAFNITDKKGMEMAQAALGDFFSGKPMIFRTSLWAKAPGPTAEFEVYENLGALEGLNTVEKLISQSGYGGDQIYRLSELETIRRDSVYAPLLKINDTLCLFDHTNGRLLRFGPHLERTDMIFIDYQNTKGWRKLLLQDATNNRVYTRFSNQNGLVLKEIDPKTGQVGKMYDLKLAPYLADKFKIRNGVLYFIGQPEVTIPNKILYKMNIFAATIKP